MKRFLLLIILASCTVALASAQSIWSIEHLAQVKQKLDKPFYKTAYQELIAEADALLAAEPLSVMQKGFVPISGDKHDYMSQARYTWPDPTKPDGLPYITRDGVTNPEIYCLDRIPLGETANRVETLALAWYFSGDERYAAKATEFIRVWFLNKETKMNPHLEFAQIARGHNGDRGRCFGLIDSYSFVWMLEGVQLLEGSKSFTKKDAKQLRQWFAAFTRWMLTSEQGIEEGAQGNNHSVAYDAQIAAYQLFIGQTKEVRQLLETLPEHRIFPQIEPDGSQPHELRRTLAYHYSQYNITHFLDLIQMGKKLGLRIDRAVSSDGRSYYKALDFLASYTGKSLGEWPYKQISGWEDSQQNFCRDLYRTAIYLDDPEGSYLKKFYACRKDNPKDRFRLLYMHPSLIDEAYAFADQQLRFALTCAEKAKIDKSCMEKGQVEPRSIAEDGSLAMVGPKDWCSGFFPGNLWQMYEFTHNDFWREQAISWTWPIEMAKNHGGTHDLGFMIGDSFGKAWELTGERSYRDVVLRAAKTLSTRFSENVGCIRSWDHNRDKWTYPVIIDNMMNLEMMFKATQISGDSTFWKIAVRHADTTMKNHFRSDFSSYHVVDYDPETGAERSRVTHQGLADDSFWSRGQGWGVYGYTMCYRFTRDPRYLKQAISIADFILSLPNIPADGIFYWDMKVPSTLTLRDGETDESVARDASAAALIASALYELSEYVKKQGEEAKTEEYRAAADRILDSLHNAYESKIGENQGFLLLHSTGHHPAGSEIDVPIIYADYYYLEALARKNQIKFRR